VQNEKGEKRKAGTQWLVRSVDCDGVYFPNVDEKIEKQVTLTVLTISQYWCALLVVV
jgi:hypothetical protein